MLAFSWLRLLTHGVTALDFRLYCGGERAIVEHNHNLVVAGAEYLANELGTEVMRSDSNELIAAMANVRLPMDDIPAEQQDKAFAAVYLRLLDDYDISAAAYKYCGKLYIRIAGALSCSIYCTRKSYKTDASVIMIGLHSPNIQRDAGLPSTGYCTQDNIGGPI